MKIAVVGTHGFGKNVLVNMLGDYCQNLGETYVHGTEFNYMDLLNSPDPIDHAFMEITKTIMRETHSTNLEPNYLILNGCAIDPLIYLNAMTLPYSYPKELERYALNWVHTYDTIFYVTPPYDFIPSKENLHGERFKEVVAEEFSLFMNEFIFNLNINVIQLESDDIHNKRIQSIFKNVLEDEYD